jgi:hypothetical protein
MADRGRFCRYYDADAAEPAVYLIARDRAQTVTRRSWQKTIEYCALALVLASLPFALGACAAAALPLVAAQAAQGGVTLAGYGAIQAGQSRADKHTPGSLDDQEERCDALVGATPGVEEVRKTKQDVIEARQLRLVNAEKPRWMIVAAKNGDELGWEPKPGITKLKFSPPLDEQLDYQKSQFIAYAPNDLDNIDDSRMMTSVTDAFGEPSGTFQWHGKTYGYTMVPRLPCFPFQK